MRKCSIVLFLAIVLLLCVSCITAYLIPVSKPQTIDNPFRYEQSNYIELDEMSIHYRIFRSNNGQVRGKLLLIHGFGGSTASFENLFEPLVSEGYLVLAVDLPEFGYSMRSDAIDHSQEARATLLWKLIETIDQDKTMKWHLMGHSMGGAVVATMALQRPDRYLSLILVDPAFTVDNRSVSFPVWFAPAVRWVQVNIEHILSRESKVAKLLEDGFKRKPTEEEVLRYLEPLKIPGTARGAKAIVKTSTDVSIRQLQGIYKPVLAIWGALDDWTPVSISESLVHSVSQADIVVIEEAGHFPFETHPEQTLDAILHHLAIFDDE